MSAYQNLTTLYRGEPSPFSWFGRGNLMKGRYFTPDLNLAKLHASGVGGTIKSMTANAAELAAAKKFKNYLKHTKKIMPWLNPHPDVVTAPRSLVNKSALNWGQTLAHNISAGSDFLKNYGIKSLSALASLPVQAGIMTMYPTTANADEAGMSAEDFRNLAIQQRNLSQHRNVPGTPIVPVGAEAYGHSRGGTDTGGYSGPPTRSFDPGAAQPQRPTRPGGFTDPGRGSYGPWMSHGGLARILGV